MRKKYLKFIILLVFCQALFWKDSFKAEAIPVGVVADAPALIQYIKEMLTDTLIKAAKHGAMSAIVSEVNSMVGKGSDGPLYITNWRDALEAQPDYVTQRQMGSLFETMGKGRNGDYVAADGSSRDAGGMLGVAEQAVMDMSIPQILNMAEYGVNDPKKVFNQKNMRAFLTAYGSTGGIGNTAEAILVAAEKKLQFSNTNKKIAEAQAVANNGYYSKMSGGSIITPGSSIRDMVAAANGMTFTSLATSATVQEAIGGLVSRTVSGVVKKGIGSAKKEVEETTGLNVNSAAKSLNGMYSAYDKGRERGTERGKVKGSF